MGIAADVWTVRQMSELVAQVKDEQSYIVVRERTHRNTAESTNSRIKWWSIFQLLFLIGQGVFQVWWLKRFFEVSHLRLARLKISKTDAKGSGQARSVRDEYTNPRHERFCMIRVTHIYAAYPASWHSCLLGV
jgi:hypothetical protein